MSEVKQRKKGISSSKTNEGSQNIEKQSSYGKLTNPRTSYNQSSFWMDSRTSLTIISLAVCLVVTWFLFQQSVQFTDMERKYNFLQQEAEKILDVENKVNLISEKLASSESVLQEAASSISVMTDFEQEISSLHNIINDIQNNEQTLSLKMQSINKKFQNVTNSWRRSLDEMNTNTSGLKSEAKFIHTEVTSQINEVDQRLKSLSERVEDLEDSTARNIRTVKTQEDDEFSRVEHKLDLHAKAVEKLEEEQNSLVAKDTDLNQKLANYEPKIEECKTHLPTIENAIHSILRLSSELLGMEKKIQDLTTQLFTVENNMLKTVSDTMAMQKVLEGIQYNGSLLKVQHEIAALETVVPDITVSSKAKGVTLESYNCEKTWNLMEQLEDLEIISHIKHLQEDIYTMKTWSSSIIRKQEELQKNLTSLYHAVSSIEQNAASVAKNITLTIVTVKTDIRRISGLVSEMTALTDSLQALEDKVEKGEKTTVKNIGDLLTSSIDRSTKIQSLASSNARKIEQMKMALSELRSDFNKHSDRLLNLEGDRAKVLKTVTFANDLKPKMYKVKKEFAVLEPLINDLTLRIGRLVEEVLRREKEIALLNEKLANLTRVQTEIKDVKDEITKISDLN
ncbi:inhibitor of nuclear factor kappa-B kinase-interacting protein isoform X1 [Pipra filicauda]|uniref:Inhibitor of nuclear factor kappa-B kinase-interacting protein isoform X1 n=1 Tax=Pipra filicauda TaxID=649802 RepID=A0A7R5L2Q7_9PASS|nr:inhibitor of nuclear factor kappa-B kinase-interacting protein isoform X1 [Pipra filicauda]